ncbi:unnamed protein product [Polarella glacialis]|uniref:Uncharacterized protein n=1 Tax=Polarella glacialis TaxID=89957 RepID=A0A813EK79_POLGL|nr:unnamed protein product [Polarella glacialis]CAE8681063.1 unnamed protein product [Polarella glacialis]
MLCCPNDHPMEVEVGQYNHGRYIVGNSCDLCGFRGDASDTYMVCNRTGCDFGLCMNCVSNVILCTRRRQGRCPTRENAFMETIKDFAKDAGQVGGKGRRQGRGPTRENAFETMIKDVAKDAGKDVAKDAAMEAIGAEMAIEGALVFLGPLCSVIGVFSALSSTANAGKRSQLVEKLSKSLLDFYPHYQRGSQRDV